MTRIKLTDLARPGLTTAQKWRLILCHFLASPYGERAIGEEVLNAIYTEYKRYQRQETDLDNLKLAAQPVAQLTADLRHIRPCLHLKRGQLHLRLDAADHLLIDATGHIARGAQSRLGESLGIPNAGQSNRERILAILDRLQTKMAAHHKKAA